MKKVLFATTALMLSAGFATAEVKFSGDARMGLQHMGSLAAGVPGGPAASRTMIEKRFSLNIDGSTTADNGVTFGARVRIRSDENNGTAVNGARVWARTGGLTVAAGNILGAIESMPGIYTPSVGLTGLGWAGLVTNVTGAAGNSRHFDWDAYDSRGNGAEGLEVIYSAGDLTVHLSHSSDKLRGVAGGPARNTALYGSYKFGDWTAALGFADDTVNSRDKVILTLGGKIGDFGVGLAAARNGSGASKINKVSVSGSYTFGATTVNGYVASQSVTPLAAAGLGSKTTYGIGMAYNMGGGARVLAGIERTALKQTRADVGVAFSF